MEPLIPDNLNELLSLMETPGLSPVAGGTDYMVAGNRHEATASQLLDISAVKEFKGIYRANNELVIGSLETMGNISGHPEVRKQAACLSQAAGRVGSWQIRSRATIGGNLANGSPAADTPATLAALEGRVKLVSISGERRTAVENVPTGPNKTSLRPGELIASFHIPLRPGRVSAFGKIGSRTEVSIARLNLAVSVIIENGEIREARVFLGTLGTAALRSPGSESVLFEQGLGAEETFGRALAETAAEAIPGRPTLVYKQSAVKALAQDVLSDLRKQQAGKVNNNG